jgi:glycosyltransferase involved in cell wall biosynthesis
MNKKVSILIPCFNEEEGLPMLYDALCGTKGICENLNEYDFEILLINDGSRDCTLNIIKKYAEIDKRIKYISLSRNFGKECAMLSGFDYASGDCMVIMDADLQHPPTLIPEMLKYWEQGYEDVYAKRKSRGKESWLRKHLSLTYYNLLQKTSRFDILENVGDFRLLDRKCIDALQTMREKERYTKGMFAWIGFKKKEILFDRADRQYGNTHWNFFQLAGLAIEGFTSFTTAPLRWSTFIGILTAIGAILLLIRFLIQVIFWGEPVAGFPTLITVILFLGAVQLIAIGVLGEYLGRIFNESKNRPVYLVREYHEMKEEE